MSAKAGAGRWRVERLDEVDSTQEEAKRRLRAGASLHGVVLRAAVQRAGRGRRGRAFASEAGGSYQSLVRRDDLGLWRHGAVTLAVAVGLAEACEARRAPLALKWPNDLVDASGRKCGGLLGEHVRGHLVVGVGLNVRHAPQGFGKAALDLDEAHAAVLEGVDRGLLLALEPDRLPAAYARWDALAGRSVTVEARDARSGTAPIAAGETVVGRAEGVSPDGALVVTQEARRVAVAEGTILRVHPPLDRNAA